MKVPAHHDPEKFAARFTLLRRKKGNRLILATPFLFAKHARSPVERRSLSTEVANARAAGKMMFWSDIALGLRRIWPSFALSARMRPATLEDHAALAHLNDRLLQRAVACPAVPMHDFIAPLRAMAHVAPEACREEMLREVAPYSLPRTGMHGDFHLYNFVRRRRGGYLLTDWEHFDAAGSFAFDYMNFFLSQDRWNSGESFAEFLSGLSPETPAIARAAREFGVSARALLMYYSLMRIEVMIARADAGPIKGKRRAELLRVVEKACRA